MENGILIINNIQIWYIFFTIIFLAIYKMALGFGYDGNKELSTKLLKNGIFGSNYLINENFLYLIC